jgi:hypothetical protein
MPQSQSKQTPVVPSPTSFVGGSSGQPHPQQLSLPQILDVYGKRILQLEKALEAGAVGVGHSETTQQSYAANNFAASPPPLDEQKLLASIEGKMEEKWKVWAEDLHSKCDFLASEVSDLKDVLLHLQDYTMTVNKRLLEGAYTYSQGEEEDKLQEEQTQTQTIEPVTEVPVVSNEVVADSAPAPEASVL